MVAGSAKHVVSEKISHQIKHCGRWETGPIGREGVREAPLREGFQVITKEKVSQEHVYLMAPGPAADSSLRHAAGVLLTRLLYRKRSPKKEFLIVDAAMNDLIRPALYQSHHEIVPVRKSAVLLFWPM